MNNPVLTIPRIRNEDTMRALVSRSYGGPKCSRSKGWPSARPKKVTC